MAKKPVDNKEIDLDNFDFDDFDFDMPDFEDPDPTKDDRKPVDKLAAGFKSGFKDQLLNPDTIKRSMSKALPRGYGQAINVFDSTSDTAKELYHSVAADLKPVTDGMRVAAGKISPKIKAKLPKSLATKLENFAEGGYSSSTYSASKMKRESEDGEISNSLAELFKAQAGRDNEVLVQEQAQDAVRDSIAGKRHEQSLDQMTVVARGVSRLVGYQDQVLSKYQQKSLELQFRHYFVARDTFEAIQDHNVKMISAMDKVVKNTALPEAVKIQKSEMASQMLKARLLESSFKNVGNWTRNYRDNLTKNVKDLVTGFTSNIAMGADMGGGMIDEYGAAKGAGYLAGNALAGKLHDAAATRLAPHLDKIPGLRKFGAKMGNLLSSAPRKLNVWSKSETEGDGVLSTITQLIKDVLPKHYLDDRIQTSGVTDSDAPATFDNLTRKSIVEIIPGWLSQINRWTKAIATGQLDDENQMDVYNLEKGRFTSRASYLNDIKRKVMPTNEIDTMRSTLHSFIDELDDQGDLAEGTRKSLMKRLLSATANGEAFDPKTLMKREFYKGVPEEHVDDLRYFFKYKFGIDMDGNVDDTVENHDKIGELQSSFNRLEHVLPNSGDYIRNLHQVYGTDNLERLNLINRVGNTTSINYNNIWDQIVDGGTKVPGADDVRSPYTLNPAFGGGPRPSPLPAPLPEQPRADTGSDKLVTGLDQYLGKESVLVQELIRIRGAVNENNISGLIAQQGQILVEINGKIGYINQGGSPTPPPGNPNNPGSFFGRAGQMTKNGLSRVGKLGKGYFDATMSMYKGLGSGAWWSAGKLGKGIKTLGNKLVEKGKGLDIYIKGQTIPALRNQLLEAGEYIDANTKKIIRSVNDITGEVRDRHGNIVVSQKEYLEGLVSQTGKSILGKATSLMGSIGNGLLNLYTMPYKFMWKGIKASANKLFTEKKEQLDLYIKGETSPRLLKRVMEENGYFDRTTKKVIRSFKDIKGDVVDQYGNIVVTFDEIKKSGGFFDAAGRLIRSGAVGLGNLSLKAIKLYGQALALPFKAARWLGSKLMAGVRSVKSNLSGKFKSTGIADDDLVTLSYYQLSVQERMFNFLQDTFAKKRVAGDSDGDGVREGSLKDLLAKRQSKRDAEAALAAKGTKKKGMWGSMSSALAALMKKKEAEKEEGDGDSLLDDAGNVKEIADWANGDGKTHGRRGRGRFSRLKKFGGKALRFGGKLLGGAGAAYGAYSAYNNLKDGNYGDAALDGAMSLGGIAMMGGGGALAAAGSTALGAAGAIAGGIATGIGAILGSPVLLGAAATAAIGYGGYKLYQHIANKPEPLSGMRYAQYGINPRDPEQVAKIAALENMLIGNLQFSQDGPAKVNTSTMGNAEALKMLSIFDIDGNDQSSSSIKRSVNFAKWLQSRFLPVFIAHTTALNHLAGDVKLADIDSKLPVAQGLDFIKAAKADELKGVYDDTDTSPFDDDLDSDADTVQKWVEDATNILTLKAKDKPAVVAESTAATANPAVAAAAAATSTTNPKAGIDTTYGRSSAEGASKANSLMTSVGKGVLLGAAVPVVAATAMFGGWDSIKNVVGFVFPEKKKPKVTLDALTAGRYRVYGLVELDLDKVEALYNLEDAMWNDVKYDDSKGSWYDGTSDSLYPIVKNLFGINDDDSAHRADWFMWFRFRYLPAFMQFCTSVRSKQAIDARDAAKKLTLDEQHEVLVQTSASKSEYEGAMVSVWKVDKSPWKNYTLNNDEASIAGNIAALKTAGKDAAYKDRSQRVADAKTEIEMARRQENMDKDGNSVLPGEDEEKDDRNIFSKGMDYLFGGKDPSGKRTGGWFGDKGDPNQDFSGGTAGPLKGGAVVQDHPGGGTGGDINQIPVPTGKGWAGSKDTIMAAAKMAGFDPAIAATVAGLESDFDPGVKAGTSSAGGYYQFIDETWATMLKKYGAKYGLAANASKYDGRANALMGMEYLKENAEYLKTKLGRPITDTDLYAAHFLGPNGAARFLTAPTGSDSRLAVGDNVPGANRNIFFDKSGNARTVAGVYAELDRRMDSSRKKHDVPANFKFDTAKVDEQGTVDTGTGTADTVPGPSQSTVDVSSPNTHPGSDPSSGTLGDAAIDAGKTTAAAQGVQSTSTAGLTTPVPQDTSAPSAAAQAVIAQKQASVESSALSESLGSVSALMTQQLNVQTAMDSKLALILETLKAKSSSGDASATATPQPTPQRDRPTKSSDSLSKVPVDVSRQQAR